MPQINYMRGAKVGLKKQRFMSFILILLLLSSCTVRGGDEKELEEMLSSVTNASYTAKITASFPAREAVFTISYTHTPEADRASVIAPAEVAGTTYTVSGEDGFLEFDGAILEVGRLDETGVSPFSSIYSLLSAWKSGAFSEVNSTVMHGKRAYLAISHEMHGASQLEYRTWFSKDDFLPLYAEIFSDGERIIMCEFERAEHNTK